MTKQQEARLAILNQALELVVDNNLLLNLTTNTGKTYISLKCLELINGKCLILVPQRPFIHNWKEELFKHSLAHLLGNITFECYASLKKHVDKQYDLVICDEAHGCVSDSRIFYAKQIISNKWIFLSATVNFKVKEALSLICNYKTIKLTTDKAIEDSILTEPKIYIHELTLNPEQLAYYTQLTNDINKAKILHYRLKQKWTENKWLQLASVRKNWLANQKTVYVKELLKTLKNKKFICFTNNINQCNELGGKYAIHSKVFNVQELIDKFNNNKIKKLFSVRIGQEGLNLSGIEAGILMQLDSEEKSYHQICGRVFRSKEPQLHVIVIKNTRDEEYFDKIKQTINNKYLIYV